MSRALRTTNPVGLRVMRERGGPSALRTRGERMPKVGPSRSSLVFVVLPVKLTQGSNPQMAIRKPQQSHKNASIQAMGFCP
jgi:hypothetical protein